MENTEKVFIFTSAAKTHSGVRSFISFIQEHINIDINNAPYFYRSIFVPLASHISTRFGVYGLLIPSIADGNLEKKIALVKETDIVNAMVNLIKESTKEIAKSLPEIWDIPQSFNTVKNEIEDIADKIFKEKHVMWIEQNTWEAMNLLTLAIHYESLMISLFYQMGDIILSLEEKLGYFNMYKRIVAETMLSYAMAPAFQKDITSLPSKALEAVLPMIEDVITRENVKDIYQNKHPLLSYPYGIVRDILNR